MKNLREFECKDKKILVRCDFNVPLSEQGNILDDFRIKQSLPTIEYLQRNKAKVILLSHLGRPQGDKLNINKYSLKPIAARIEELLKTKVKFLPDCIGGEVRQEVGKIKAGEIVLLENLRFHKEEEENDSGFAKELASLGDIYVNDAFAVCHREHASVVAITQYLPSGQGFLLEKEIKILNGLLENPQKPLVAIVGGKKIETRLKLIDRIAEIADWVLVGGLLEREIKEKNIKLKVPEKIIVAVDNVEGLDIGPRTINLFREKIKSAKTVFWSGSLGKTEDEKFQKGSREIISAIIKSKAFSIAGGGETVKFINQLGESSKFNHLSTGGGAMLAFLSGEELPGIKALE